MIVMPAETSGRSVDVPGLMVPGPTESPGCGPPPGSPGANDDLLDGEHAAQAAASMRDGIASLEIRTMGRHPPDARHSACTRARTLAHITVSTSAAMLVVAAAL